jgi:hypothetical protein
MVSIGIDTITKAKITAP